MIVDLYAVEKKKQNVEYISQKHVSGRETEKQ